MPSPSTSRIVSPFPTIVAQIFFFTLILVDYNCRKILFQISIQIVLKILCYSKCFSTMLIEWSVEAIVDERFKYDNICDLNKESKKKKYMFHPRIVQFTCTLNSEGKIVFPKQMIEVSETCSAKRIIFPRSKLSKKTSNKIRSWWPWLAAQKGRWNV